jgi:hypothetical protein
MLSAPGICAQNNPNPVDIQVVTGYIDPGEREVYRLSNLRCGDRLYIYMLRLSSSLDPLFAVADGKFKMEMFDDRLSDALKKTFSSYSSSSTSPRAYRLSSISNDESEASSLLLPNL